MSLRTLAAFFLLLFAPASFAHSSYLPSLGPSSPSQFQVREQTAVPNTTLKPGTYSIRILDHLRDRVILQVQDRHSKVESTFIAVPASTMASAPSGPIPYSAGPKGKAALKGFSFPGGVAVEFVYPKNDAVSLAKANDARVMAIDPASEGRVDAANLKAEDMQMVSLWMLEPARVGPNDAKPTGIAASKYQAPTEPASQGTEVASAPSPSPATSYEAPAPARNTVHQRQPVQLAQNDVPPSSARVHTRPAVKALPHTASELPLVALIGFCSLALGGGLALRRLAVHA